MKQMKMKIWDKKNKEFCNLELGWIVNFFNKTQKLDLDDFTEYEIIHYTGAKDFEGSEIYEGDIVEFFDGFDKKNVQGIVYYDLKYLSYNLKVIGSDSFYSLFNITPTIIGNIYENPKLLEEENKQK